MRRLTTSNGDFGVLEPENLIRINGTGRGGGVHFRGRREQKAAFPPWGGQEGAVWEGPRVRGCALAFVCVCVCEGEASPLWGLLLSFGDSRGGLAEGSEVKMWVFPSVPRAPCGLMARGACPRGFPVLSGRM